jgi:hypothetical protein
MTDEIVLTLPRERRFYDVAHLVVGGLAVRLELTVDALSDLQLAMAGLLPHAEADGEVTVVLRIGDEVLNGRIGPFQAEVLRRELEREGGDGYGPHHVLETVFDSYRLDVEDASAWVEFTLSTPTARKES